MKVTFIGHSGFLVETESRNYLFDYFKGTIPRMEADKPLFVFVSHKHVDHFNPEIFKLAEPYANITFVLSYDIKPNSFRLEKWQVAESLTEKFVSVRPNGEYEFEGFTLRTLKSTDLGVAFLLFTEEGTIYHAGDLNWWYWEEADKQQNNNITAHFKREMEKLTGVSIDVAFVPLDPRQEKWYYLGMEYLMQRAKIHFLFPMHCWDDYAVIPRFIDEGYTKDYDGELMRIERAGQEFLLS